MYRLRMNHCLLSTDLHFDDFFHNIREFQCAVTNDSLNNNVVVSKWNQCIGPAKELKEQLIEFTRKNHKNLNHLNIGVFFLTVLFLFCLT